MTNVDCLDLLVQELGFSLKIGAEGSFRVAAQGKECLHVSYQQPYSSDVCSCKEFFKFRATADSHCYLACVKKGDRQTTHDFYLMPKCYLLQ